MFGTCEGKLAFFNKTISNSRNFIMPVKTRTVHNNDAPWMSDKLKFVQIKNDGLYNLGIAVNSIIIVM